MNVKAIAIVIFLLSITISANITHAHSIQSVISNNRSCEHSIRYNKNEAIFYLAKESSQEINILDFVIIYSNMSKLIYFLATKNNSILYARTHIFAKKITNYTVILNGQKLDRELVLTNRSISKIVIAIPQLAIHYIIVIKWVNSFREVEDIEKENIGLITITNYDLYRYAIAGIPATFLALIIAYFVILVRKKLAINEGLPDSI